MNCSGCLQCYIFLLLNLFSVVRTVPPEYCLFPLNHSDCNAPPQTVFTYYKPGSRCEIETWRGCPSLNKFPNEYLCSLHCIFRMQIRVGPETNPCDIPLNQEKCEDTITLVYTHKAGSCVEVEWSGCPSPNMFRTKAKCETACQVTFEKRLLNVDKKVLDVINKELDKIIDEEMTTIEPVTDPIEADTEAVTEADTEAIADAEIKTDPVTRPTVMDDYNF
ncbi:hypothetical protein PYW08_003601 [Mythimna loreyi]|uniref:Uncharacterized protein n=1 Tax=Mythimna loreyi TaxID=667449 RepID=A0ACC2QT16_9NEOP|nr:hypothetical protein PYW08_003601 [Mythimna loreyi]